MTTKNLKLSLTEALGKLKAMAFGEAEPAAGDNNPVGDLKDYADTSGTKYKIDKLEVGGLVFAEDGKTAITVEEITLADGTVLKLDGQGAITEVTVPTPAGEQTPEESKAIAMSAVQKFATGTPEERIANLETMCQALMIYCFGWKIEESARKAIEESAIAAYKSLGDPAQLTQDVAALKSAMASQKVLFTAQFKAATETIQTLGDSFLQFATDPSDDPVQIPAGNTEKGNKEQRRTAALQTVIAAKKLNTEQA